MHVSRGERHCLHLSSTYTCIPSNHQFLCVVSGMQYMLRALAGGAIALTGVHLHVGVAAAPCDLGFMCPWIAWGRTKGV